MDSVRRPRRVLLALLAVSCVLTAAAVVAGSAASTRLAGARSAPGTAVSRAAGSGEQAAARPVAPSSGRGPAPLRSRPDVRAAALLHAWDVRRARAWADGDLAGLRALYV